MNLSLENVTELLRMGGSPLYVYFEKEIYERIRELRTTLGKYSHTQFLYAVKTNFNPHIVKIIIENGFGIDAVSVEEIKIGLLAGAHPKNILFTENNSTDDDMHEAMRLGVLINVGSLSRLEKVGMHYPGSSVCIRFNPNVGAACHSTNITGGPDSKFGISFSEIENIKKIAQEYSLKITGIHEHIGSGWLDTKEPLLALDFITEIAKQFPDLEFIDCGGGFGVPYSPTEHRLDLTTLGEEIKKRIENFCKSYGKNIQLRFEPGRYVVAESGHLLTRVNTLKVSPEKKIFVGTDTGMNHLVRVAMYGSYHPIVNTSNPNGETKKYQVVGNICENADFFAKDRDIPEIREGDILDIQIAGAYGMSMASEYQFRPRPAEILIDKTGEPRIIRKRQTFEEMIQTYNF